MAANVRVQQNTGIRTGQQTTQQINQSGGSQAQINWGDSSNEVPVESYEPSGGWQGDNYGNYYDEGQTYDLGQAVESSLQGLTAMSQEAPATQQTQQAQQAQPTRQAQAQQTQPAAPRQMTARPAQTQQEAPAPEGRREGIPVVNASDLQTMGTASRRQRTPETSDLTDVPEAFSGFQAAVVRSTPSNPISPMPSARAEREAINRRREETRAQDEGAQQVDVIDGKPQNLLNRPFGYTQKSRAARTVQPSTKRPASVIDSMKKRAARMFKRKGRGNGVWGKVIGLKTLNLREVGVGMEELRALVDQESAMLERLLTPYLTDDMLGFSNLTTAQIADIINANEVMVATFKPPAVQGQDAQSRRLKVLKDHPRGMYLHPLMAAMYTADFDGDDMGISLDPGVEMRLRDPMSYMVDIYGKQTLNMDFLRTAKIVDMENQTARQFVRDVVMDDLDVDGRTVSRFVDAVLALGDAEDQAAAYGEVFRAARDAADKASRQTHERSDAIMERLCRSVVDTMDKLSYVSRTTDADALMVDIEKLPRARTYNDDVLYRILNDMVDGVPPNNFQELKVMLSGFIGNVEGKNPAFRFTADIGKMMKMDERMRVGNEYVVDLNNRHHMEVFFEATVRAAYSARMQREVKKAGRSEYYTHILRDEVIREVGFPESYGRFHEFLRAFVRSYNKHSSIINMSNLIVLSNENVSSDSRGVVSAFDGSPATATLSELAEPLMSVYGTYSIRRMFKALAEGPMSERESSERDPWYAGNPRARKREGWYEQEYRASDSMFWITNKYLDYNLRQFRNQNRLLRGSNADINLNDIRKRTISSLERMQISDVSSQFEMLVAIADKKTGVMSTFNKQTFGSMEAKSREDYDGTTVKMMSDLLMEVNRLEDSDRRDQMLFANDALTTLIESDPDLFNFYDMDSPAGFLHSEFGQKMLQHANDYEVIGGILTTMIFRYQMERVDALRLDLLNQQDTDRFNEAYNKFLLAKDELADRSEVWSGIMRELEAEDTDSLKSVFQMKREGRGLDKSVELANGTLYHWNWRPDKWDAESFWRNPGDHATLRSVIEDLDMDRMTKWNVITDVVRYWENDAYLKSYEIGYQMEIADNSDYTINGAPGRSATRVHRDFEASFNKWGKMTQEKLQEEVDKAFEKHSETSGALMTTLQRLDQNPWELVSIDDHMYADSILSVMDKTYAQSEKSQQNPWTNAVYAACSFQQNGGYRDDLYRCDDRLLGIVSVNDITVHDVIHILANPEEDLYVYNDYGEWAMLSRDILLTNSLGRELSQDVEMDIWEFLRKEPRIASAIRKHSTAVMADSDGKGYLGSVASISETIQSTNETSSNNVEHVKYLMRDHPVYAAILSLSLPGKGVSARNQRERLVQIENYVACQMYLGASSGWEPLFAADEILSELGITQQNIRRIMQSNYDTFLEQLGLDAHKYLDDSSEGRLESAADADLLYGAVLEYMGNYIEEIRKAGVPLGQYVNEVEKPSSVGPDIVSCASFWDVVQELGGAKTSVSTGVEGSETYKYANWVSHIKARDHYADLDALDEVIDVTEEWNGAWTNVVGEDGGAIKLEVDEQGNVANWQLLHDAAKEQNITEIVVSAPISFLVKDRSTDSKGNQVQSLFALMVSKRANGAETFNLKAKKTGLDGKDSITKMRGKYRIGDDGRRVKYLELQSKLDYIARSNGENGLQKARLELAQMMLRENEELGYKDLTLANYMSVAELMVIEDANGKIVLRSLEMLLSAIKNRIGFEIDEMNDADLTARAMEIINDVSETGVGIAKMDSLEAFDKLRPAGRAANFSAIRQQSSVFARNYDLMRQLNETAMSKGKDVLSDRDAQALSEEYSKIDFVSEFLKRMDMHSNYRVIGYAGADDGSMSLVNWSVGPANSIIIGDGPIDQTILNRVLESAYEFGITVFVGKDNRDLIPSRYLADAMPCSAHGDVIIPMFDIRLNGSEATPGEGRFGIHQVPFSRYVVSVEDSVNEFGLGDAQVAATKNLTDRTKAVHTDTVKVKAEDLFPNVFKNREYKDCSFTVGLANGNEVQNLIANGVRCTIDYGVTEGSPDFEQRKRDVDKAIERYQGRWGEATADGLIMGEMSECAPGDIVGWMQIEIVHPPMTRNGRETHEYVFAPIIPYQLHGATKNVMESFTVENIGKVDDDATIIQVDMRNTSDITTSNAKYFDSSGGANKGMVSFADTIQEDRVLMDGTKIDVYIARESTDSRKIGTDRRIKTMISLMALARMHGYNFALRNGEENMDAFPNNPDVREELMHGRIQRSDWEVYLSDPKFVMHTDPYMDAFLKFECNKFLQNGGNPSDYLACSYTTTEGVEHNSHVMWEFEAMFEQGLNYEDQLLKFLNMMDPTFCPAGIEDSGEHLFRLRQEDGGIAKGYETGVLQMRVPHRLADGRMSYVWDTVNIGMSFFGEDYSGFSRPNVSGASNYLDAMNTMSMYGATLSERDARIRNDWASSDFGRISRDGGAFGLA